ncbi:hypothetical protein T4D_15307 [Trichinella pseudospiralis]|uniref:Uncharacterized protein n=1 Tax=Trichinella pseudospiralis TaxID=6337 RepID=A0A0V1G201_TRIPS|nr:hypothetical protein T4D_15307 [Trichinella pseudospiralis]
MIIWKEPSINNRVYHLKQTNFVDRQKAFQQAADKYTSTPLKPLKPLKPLAHTFSTLKPDNDILYKIKKRLELHGRIQTLLTNIYKGASRTTADLETAGRFPTHKNVLNMCLQCAENREKISRAASNAPGAGNFPTLVCAKVWLQFLLYNTQQVFTIYVFKAGNLSPLVYCLTVRKDKAT